MINKYEVSKEALDAYSNEVMWGENQMGTEASFRAGLAKAAAVIRKEALLEELAVLKGYTLPYGGDGINMFDTLAALIERDANTMGEGWGR